MDVLKFASEHPGEIEACAIKPGLIKNPGEILKATFAFVIKYTLGVPNITNEEICAAMLDQISRGFEKEPLLNDDLVVIGQRLLAENKSS